MEILQPGGQTAKLDYSMKLPLAAVCLVAAPALFGQPTMPSWLAPYPGATPQTKTYQSLAVATYTTDAAPELVTDHYRKLFEAQNLTFRPNSDGIGTMVRATAPECDLLITIRSQGDGTSVGVNCSNYKPVMVDADDPMPSHVIAGGEAAIQERHQQNAADKGVHTVYEDAEAPPLIWPEWLVPFRGGRLNVQAFADSAGNKFLKASFVTYEPKKAIRAFYRGLLNARGYRVRGNGEMYADLFDGTNYPNGSPGPRTEIGVSLSGAGPNGAITVELRFSTFEFKAPKAI